MVKQYYSIGFIILYLETPEKIPLCELLIHLPQIHEIHVHNVPHLSIKFEQADHAYLHVQDYHILIKGLWNNSSKQDIPHLAYSLLRQYCVDHEIYPVHSIGIEHTLFIGHSGQGKTTLALEAIKENLSVFSTDRTLLNFAQGELFSRLGTSLLSVRTKNINCIDYNKTPALIGYTGERELCYYRQENQPNLIHSIILFQLTEEPLFIEKISSTSALHQLYPYFLDVIKQDVLLSQSLLFCGYNSNHTKQLLACHLESWLKHHNVSFYSGTKKDIIQYLKNTI